MNCEIISAKNEATEQWIAAEFLNAFAIKNAIGRGESMDNIWIIIITSLLSGVLATVLTLVCQKYGENKREKRLIFETLMAHRYMISDQDNVEALNRIEVTFYEHKEVRAAWKDFIKATNDTTKDPTGASIEDAYIKLLEKIAAVIGYEKIRWDEIKKYYFPKGLSTKIAEETALRKAQIQQATRIAKQDRPTSDPMTLEEAGMQLVLSALNSSDGMKTLGKIIELGEKKSGGKSK